MRRDIMDHLVIIVSILVLLLGLYSISTIEGNIYALEAGIVNYFVKIFLLLVTAGALIVAYEKSKLLRKFKIIYAIIGTIIAVLMFLTNLLSIVTLTFSVSLLISRVLPKGKGTIFLLVSLLVPFVIFYNNHTLTKEYFNAAFIGPSESYINNTLNILYGGSNQNAIYSELVESLVQSFDYGYSAAALVSYNITSNYTLMYEILSYKDQYTNIFRNKVMSEISKNKQDIMDTLNVSNVIYNIYDALESNYYLYLVILMTFVVNVFVGIYLFFTNIWSLILEGILAIIGRIRSKKNQTSLG